MDERLNPPADGLFQIDLGCGNNKNAGYVGIDKVKTDSTDFVWDLTKTPWPIDSGVVDRIWSSHFFEHLSGPERIPFMDECWRVLKPKGQVFIVVPYYSSMRAIQDPFHAWPPVCEASFIYFNAQWRKDNKLDHYPINCDFDFGAGHSPDPELLNRNQEYQAFAVKHYLNAVNDLHVTLTKRA